jgi:hypothetical protein
MTKELIVENPEESKLLAQMKAIEDCPIRGHLRKLDGTRLVFLGQDPAHPDLWFLGFRNGEGQDTMLKLSQEAYNALTWLFGEKFKGERVRFPYVLHTYWQVVLKEKEADQ